MSKRKLKEYLEEFKPPEKKLLSSGDLLIKELSRKQQNTKITLIEELAHEKLFDKSTSVLPITSFNRGECSLKHLQDVEQKISDVEFVKSVGLCDEDVQLYFDYQKGLDFVIQKHRNFQCDLLMNRINKVIEEVENYRKSKQNLSSDRNADDTKNEAEFAIKPDSNETKLLKFALANQEADRNKIPHPMDHIQELEANLNSQISYLDTQNIISKVRRKARKLASRIEDKLRKPTIKLGSQITKWDVQETCIEPERKLEVMEKKNYGCKMQKLFTLKNGVIVELDKAKDFEIGPKMSLADIIKMPRFENYKTGEVNRVLYIKNLPSKVCENNLRTIFHAYDEVSYKVMGGKMKGQAFVTFKDQTDATAALNDINGTVINGKPIVIQYGKKMS